LWPHSTPIEKPILPVIYAQPEAQLPPTPANPADRQWVSQESMPTKRAGLGLVASGGRIYAIGGVRENNQATRLVEIYDPIANTWSEGAAKPTAAANISGVAVNDKIYVPGGCTNKGEALKVLEIYDPQDDSWGKGKILPAARCGYALAALADKIYLMGGWDGQAYVDTVLVYSVKQAQWEVAKSKLPRAMGHAAAVTLDDKLYLAGGYDGKEEFDQLYLFDPATNRWKAKASMQAKRGGLGLVGAANSLYAIGGGWNQTLASSEKYDISNDSWSDFASPLTEPWRDMGLAVVDTKIYGVGGWNETEQKFMDTAVSYQFLFQLFIPVSSGGGN
jgi:N-acetylneuraminic acid mutarotase